MTTSATNMQIAIEDINNKLISLQFDQDHKHHSAMEHFDLLRHKDNLKLEKAKLEAKLKLKWERIYISFVKDVKNTYI